MAQASSLAIVLMLVTILVLQFSTIIGTIGICGIRGLILLMVVGSEMGKQAQPQGETEQAEAIGAGS